MKFLFALMVIIALAFAVQAQLDKSVCSLGKDTGPCRSAKPSFFFNSETKACEPFMYGGCMGNDNRFTSKDDCEKLCL